jgi:hypothetical protein
MIYNPLRKILTFPKSDPTQIECARVINIIRNAEGQTAPKGKQYYEVEPVLDADGGEVDLTSPENEWILDVIDATAPEDLSEVTEPNVTKDEMYGMLSEEQLEIIGISNDVDTVDNNSDDIDDPTVPPECFAKAFDDNDVTCVGDENTEECYYRDECRLETPEKTKKPVRRGAKSA